ncbi:T9SS type A sorting domain-containing protein [Gramella jeungdoensis]|uniref:T9SS type A sorting domain-containing protein n=1 Tax=Gramella jeungdoensis TaxID=708091 RepID=A0A4Y8AWK4_9FLAO|nr:T9SS type A sorting domain-containing protein [Gramella jeungdoensis]
MFSLPFNNFTIEVKGETCRSSNNGTITITTTENHNYMATASVNGELVTQTFLNSTSFQNLEAGTYSICITIEDEPDYESCFTTQVTKPDNLKVLSKVNLKSKIISLYLKGGDTYSIVLNNELIQITTNNLDLNLKPGINTLKITTNTACQGVYNELIELPFEDIRLFPNPIKQGENFYISTGGINTSEIEVSIYSTLGSLITSNNYKNITKSNLKIDVTNLPKGLYMVKFSSLEITKSYTIIIE